MFFTGTDCAIYINTAYPVEYLIDDAHLDLIPDDPNWKTAAKQSIDQIRKADITIR